MTPRVSFFIPSYNYGRYVGDCLSSILTQQGDHDFEILVIDDELGIVMMIKGRLEAGDHDVVIAYDGQEGMEIYHKEKPDLIICDMLMPTVDGFGFLKALAKIETTSRTPVIVLSALVGHTDFSKVPGVDEILAKPFVAEALMEKVEKLL